MKILLLSDIHANLHAMKAVLSHAKKLGADRILDLGDFLGFGAYPEEVTSLLISKDAVGVKGNFDKRIMNFPLKKEKWLTDKDRDKFIMLKKSFESLSEKSRRYADGLPEKRQLKISGKKILMVHASPDSHKEHLGPDTPAERLMEISQKSDSDIILCGHSHRPFVRQLNGTLFINPGSVGLSSDGDTRASFAIVNIDRDSHDVHHYRISYEAEKAARAILEKGFPGVYSKILLEASDYTAVKEAERIRGLELVKDAEKLAEASFYEEGHARQVAMLALVLFDRLEPLHELSSNDRIILECAAILHDIGISGGSQQHHKRSMEMILKAEMTGFTESERLLTALAARYHRKALPGMNHEIYSALSEKDLYRLDVIAGILRVADGLDRTHCNAVSDIICLTTDDAISLECRKSKPASLEIKWGKIKADLLEKALGKAVEIS